MQENINPIWKRAWRRMTRGLRKIQISARLYSDFSSLTIHDRLHTEPGKLQAEKLYPIRVRILKNSIVYCRPNTTDVQVFDDTFIARYHLPPPELTELRTILDLGSNIGLTIAHMAVVFPEARILGVELDEQNYSVCERNIEPFKPRCRVIRGAVWPSAGEVTYGGTECWGFRVTGHSNGDRTAQAYPMSQLLDMMNAPKVDYVKMDIEGAEAEVLEDAGLWLSRIRCLKVEIHSPYTVERCVETLERHGMCCTRDTLHPACIIARHRGQTL
jgi:FkbM family methyltransferase